ncbi:MAG: hypothetical protein JW745_08070 [Sedimentisphaerales bacterium]|nr:hypothetical protein [Sedimentisphaerales bacterium]MBN2843993.1 hypothetical protein [Sedimentisphaerales bacterium]
MRKAIIWLFVALALTIGTEMFSGNSVRVFADDNFVPYNNGKLRLVVVGSSVAYGSGATEDKGWAYMLKDELQASGRWEVINKSIGGNRTSDVLGRLDRDVLAYDPDFVVVGLSLANEGFAGNADVQEVYSSYRNGLKKIIQVLQANGIVPVICNCYPHSGYDQLKYDLVCQMNREIASWPVASINFLSATDDGHGRWVEGYLKDGGHPNDAGHKEMFYNIPGSLFDNYIGSLPAGSLSMQNSCWLTQSGKPGVKPLNCVIEKPLHSYSVCFDFMAESELPETILDIDSNGKIAIDKQGKLAYLAGEEQIISSETITPGKSYRIALTCSYSQQKAALYLNGELVGKCHYRQAEVDSLDLGGNAQSVSSKVKYRNIVLYRGSLTYSEIISLYAGNAGQSSLELFSPLDDPITSEGIKLVNLAPTSSNFKVQDANYSFGL